MKSNTIVIIAIAIIAICGCGACTPQGNERGAIVIPAGQRVYSIRVEDNVRYRIDDRVDISHGGKAIVTGARVLTLSNDDAIITVAITQDQAFVLDAAEALDGKFTVTKNSGDN